MKKPEDWIKEWEEMNKELKEDYALFLNIPTVEETQKWMDLPPPSVQEQTDVRWPWEKE